MLYSKSFSDIAAKAARIRVGHELTYIKRSNEAFLRTLFTKSWKLSYKSGLAGATDAKGLIYLDGQVAEDGSIGPHIRADILKGVLLDEVGHNLHPPLDSKLTFSRWFNHCDHHGIPDHIEQTGVKLLPSLHNLVEDLHNVWAITRTFPGFRQLHAAAVEYYLGDLDERITKYLIEASTLVRPTMETVINALIAASKADRPINEPRLEAIREDLMTVTLIEMTKWDRADRAIRLTLAILEMVANWDPPDPPLDAPEDEGDSEDGDEGEDGGLTIDSDELAEDPVDSDTGDSPDEAEATNEAETSDSDGSEASEPSPEASDDKATGSDPGTKISDESEPSLGDDGSDDSEAGDIDLTKLANPEPELTEEEVYDELSDELDALDPLTVNAGMKEDADAVTEAPEDDESEAPAEEKDRYSESGRTVDLVRNPAAGDGVLRPLTVAHNKKMASALKERTRFQATQSTSRISGYRRGKLARRDVHKLAMGRTDAFSRKTAEDTPHVNLGVAVDRSGSMNRSSRWDIAVNLVDILDRAYNDVDGVQLWVVDYCTLATTGNIELRILREPGMVHKPDLATIKGPDDLTPTVPALNALNRLLPQDGGDRVIILVSDGNPNVGGENPEVRAWMQTHREVRLVQLVLGNQDGADIPATYHYDDKAPMADRVTQMTQLIGTAVGQHL